MWRRVTVRNFRSIEAADVELAPFTLLVGPNGSGKSNFADALVFLRDVGFDASTAVTRRGGISGVRRWSRTKPFDVSMAVRVASTREKLETDFVEHRITIHSGEEGRWSFKREEFVLEERGQEPRAFKRHGGVIQPAARAGQRFGDLPDTTSAMLYVRQLLGARELAPLWEVKRFRLNPDLMRQPQVVTESWRLDESGSNIASAIRRLRGITETIFRREIVDAMARIVPGLTDIAVQDVGRHLTLEFKQAQAGGTASFYGTEMSEGALRALGILVAAQQMRRNELLIIEEPEVNIHAGAAQLLFDVLKHASQRGAVLVTTHSAELLDAARDEEILVCAYSEGVTRIGPLASEQRRLVRDGLFSVAELLRSEPLRIEGEAPAAIEPGSAP
ncbi:MAG: AAA family ATPase [Myxococcales bacterium]|nr:AAA family ATPase [Myxococcales bacterium]